MTAWIRRYPLLSFFALAYALSWSIAVPLALQAHGLIQMRVPWALHYLTALGPAAAALLVGRRLHTPSRDDRKQTIPSLWWAIGFGSPLLFFAVAQLAGLVSGQRVPSWSSLGQVNYLPNLGYAAWALWLVTSGCGEEFGWRGFALPRLQRTHSALASSALLTVGWAGWHIPALFYLPSYGAAGLQILPGLLLGLLAGSVVLTWMYNSSGGSVMPAVLWHTSFNFVTAPPPASGLGAAVTSTLVMVWAVVIVWRYDWATLTRRSGSRRSVRATAAEKARVLPGDEWISRAVGAFTHAITIRRAPRQVWPWLVQMGAGSRAGWYSYDWIDNGRQPSASRIVPELQHPAVGTVFPAMPGMRDGFTLLAIEPERALTLGFLTPDGAVAVTWSFCLIEVGPGVTRLLVRARGGPDYRFHGLPVPLTKLAIRIVHFVMEQKQLLGIAHRAEAFA